MSLSKGMLYGAFTVIIWTFGEMLIFPLAVSFVAKRASDKNRGKYMGLYILSFALVFVICPALGSGIYVAWGAKTLWFSGGFLGLLVSLGFVIFSMVVEKR